MRSFKATKKDVEWCKEALGLSIGIKSEWGDTGYYGLLEGNTDYYKLVDCVFDHASTDFKYGDFDWGNELEELYSVNNAVCERGRRAIFRRRVISINIFKQYFPKNIININDKGLRIMHEILAHVARNIHGNMDDEDTRLRDEKELYNLDKDLLVFSELVRKYNSERNSEELRMLCKDIEDNGEFIKERMDEYEERMISRKNNETKENNTVRR